MSSHFNGLWRQPDFLKLWAGTTIADVGTQVTVVALPLTAVLVLGAGPMDMGLLAATGGVPSLVFGVFAGAWADRLPRRPVIIATATIVGLLLGSIPVASIAGVLRIEWLYAVEFLAGLAGVLAGAAYQAYIPTLVDTPDLHEANTRLEQSFSVARTIGPGLGGALVQWLTAPIAIAVDAVSYFVADLLLLWIRHPEPPVTRPQGREANIWREMKEGLQFTLADPVLRSLTTAVASATLFNSAFFALYILYLSRTLEIPPVLLGVVLGVAGPSALVGSLLIGPLNRTFGVGRCLLLCIGVAAIGRLIVPLATGPMMVIVVLLIIGEVGRAFFNANFGVTFRTLQQTRTPPELRGRVSATMNTMSRGFWPLGSLAGGVLGEYVGIPTTMVLSVIGAAAIGLWVLWPLRTMDELPLSREGPA